MNTDKTDKKEHKPLKFGMKVENGVGGTPFVPSEKNNNPYGGKYFNSNPLSVGASEEESHITSIPSPYAPMHLANVAFMELNAGEKGIGGDEAFKNRWNTLPKSYKRAISHCLDLYELFYYFVDLDIYENGIKIEKVDLVTKRGEDKKRECEQLLGEGDSSLSRYIDTLDLYRERYITEIQDVRPASYKFDFKTLYVFKDNKGSVFGGTSPFTGFFAKPDCNLSGLETKWKVNDREKKHKLLTANSADWLPLSQRSFEFKKFMYMLLKDDNDRGTGLGKVFKSLWDTARNAIVMWESEGTENDLKALDLNASYPAFNFAGAGLPKIKSRGEKDLFLRTTDFDKTHMKYLLYLHYPSVDMKVTEEECNEDIENRTFPEGGDACRWVSVNDLLSDALYILPYEINDNYVAVEYTVKEDPQQKKYRRCLLPIKKDVLEYLDIRTQENTSLLETIAKNITIVQHKRLNQDGTEETYFVVTMDIALEGLGNGGTDSVVKLRREYCNYYKHPNGIVIGPKKLDHFAFGIYPFVRSDEFENIYKVLFYNDFRSRVQKDENGFKLEFYHMDNEVPTKYDNDEVKYNCTHSVLQSGYESQKFNSVYYNVEKMKKQGKRSPFVEFVELSYVLEDSKVKTTALIVPNLRKIEYKQNRKADIAVDLGTSNTYVAYQLGGDDTENVIIQDVCSTHQLEGGGATFNELVFMNVSPTKVKKMDKGNYFDYEDKYEHDLYLPPIDSNKQTDRQAWTVCMPAQLCEFMPARIVKSGDSGGFSFPIPTVINNYSNIIDNNGENLPLIHSAIPFAYYEMGKRTNGRDVISDGNFKWCFKVDENEDPKKVNSLGLYINELLFMIRTHLLCEKTNLKKCRLVWTYPLSFTEKLLKKTEEKWKEAFEKYFGVSVSRENMIEVNESLAPYHSVGANNEFNLLMDVGGGSTDVVGYYNQSPIFVSSFQFAGNALYMTSNKNKDGDIDNTMELPTKNIIKKRLQDSTDIKALFDGRASYFGDATELIPIGGKLNNVMNYGFTKHHEKFESFFKNSTYKLSFLALFHNAALVYHIAQLCYTKKQDEMPRKVYLAGNGSNLFKLKNEEFGKNLIKNIFKEYYGYNQEIEVEMLSKPKTAAAEGALKIINDERLIKEATLETQNLGEEKEKKIILYTFGDCFLATDGKTITKILHAEEFDTLAREYKCPKEKDLKTMRENLQKNVINFVELFDKVVCKDMYEKYPDGVSKDWLIKKVEEIKFDNKRLNVGETITDSYFFNYIAMLMEEVSEVMVKNAKAK